jgi:hypothetical protein
MADNCEPRKIDSNRVGLSFAETICGVLPTIEDDGYLPTWFELEPNSYDEMGGAVTTTARRPINASRQRKKGVITDLNANGGYNEDFTKSNFNRRLQGFLFADMREKTTTKPMNSDPTVITAAVAASDTYTASSGLSKFRVGQLVNVTGFATAANNGIKRITAVADNAITTVDGVTGVGNLVDESPTEEVVIRCVGWQMVTGGTDITLAGALGQLVLTAAAPVAASGTITFDDNPTHGDDIDIGGITYTFKAAIVDPYDVLIGVDDDATAANLAASLNGNVLGTDAHPLVSASAATNVVTVTALIKGTAGNAIAMSSAADFTFSAATLAGGTGYSFLETGLIVGEWLYLGDDTAGNRFANNTGYARISSITDQLIRFDKTTWEPAAETGTGDNIRFYVGDTIKNEKDPDLIITRYYEYERTLGMDADGLQTEYLTRAVHNELTLNIPLPEGEDAKLNADITVVAGDAEQRTGAEGRKAGTFIPALGEDAFNTASNVLRIRMAVIDPATSRPTPLFAYISEGNLSINNNVTPVKAVGTLGSIDVNVGDFDVGGEMTAIFSTVLATRAVRNNADVTVDFIAAAGNAGFVFDIPLLSLGNGILEVEPGVEVRVPLELNGAENPNEYTLLYTSWSYLPTLAMPVVGATY